MLAKNDTLITGTDLNELIKQAKQLSGIKTKREVLIYAMQLYIDFLEQQYRKTNKSFYELTKHLAGTIDGPPDLTQNKKYMEGFGL